MGQFNQGVLRGKIIDSIYHQNVTGATISVVAKNDSSVVAYGLAKKDGSFVISRIPFGNYYYIITFSGYGAIASINKFRNDEQISVITQSNNINTQNFSVEDFLGTMNTGETKNRNRSNTQNRTGVNNIFSANAQGISTTNATGINFNDIWGKKTEINGSYFFNQLNTINNRDRYRETFLINDSSLFNNSQVYSESKNRNHRLNFKITYNIDSFNALLIIPDISFQETNITSNANSSTVKGLAKPLNTAILSGNSGNKGINLNNSIMFRHRFDFDYIMNRGQSEGYNKTIPLWNVGIAKLFLKNQKGEVRLSIVDLLNQNLSINRVVEQNYIEDTKTQALKRYCLLSFKYYLKN